MMDFSPMGGVEGAMFSIVPVFIAIIFIIVIGTIIVNLIRGAKQWQRNNDSPVLTVDATVVAKRVNVYNHSSSQDDMHHTSTSTTYYVTFQVASGDRMEFEIKGTEYGLLVENDMGKLTFQGTRYLGFQREKVELA